MVVINGGLISLDEFATSAPAILMAWMPGAFGASAVAEGVFGTVNPGGKLPATMCVGNVLYYRVLDQLVCYQYPAIRFTFTRIGIFARYNSSYINEVDFLDMSMQAGPGRSYRFYTGKPLFPFGFGLSYTSFKLEWDGDAPATQTLATPSAVCQAIVLI